MKEIKYFRNKNSTKILNKISPVIALLSLFACGKKTEQTKVERKNITEMIFASGTLKADKEYNLMSQTEGYITKINFNEGDEVQTGTILAIINNPQSATNTNSSSKLLKIAKNNSTYKAPLLLQTKANLEVAKAKLQQDELQEARYKRLIEANATSKLEYENKIIATKTSKAALLSLAQQYQNLLIQANEQVIILNQQLENSQTIQDFNQVKALANGKIYKQKKQVGDYVRKGDIIAILANNKKIYANLNIDETNIAKIKLNQEIIIKLNVNALKRYKAKVSEILPTFDEQSQSFIVKAIFTKPIDFAITGTQLEANILVSQCKNTLVIPRSYLGYGNKVLNTNKKQINVQTGIISSNYVQILQGLKENQTILKELD
ncbi:efflux RND transporter periplasmic adaptor subunit [Flavobacterium psychrophilum]